MNVKGVLSQLRWLSAAGVLAVAAMSGTATPATAHSSFRFHLFVPLYAGPPAYYYPPTYYPAPAYYYPPPVYYVPAPAVAPNCSTGRWRQSDGSIVYGTTCLQPNGTWRLAR